MLVDDYTPTKRLGVEEMEGLQWALTTMMDDMEENEQAMTAAYYRLQGVWLTVHLLLTGRFKTQQDFIAVLLNKMNELY